MEGDSGGASSQPDERRDEDRLRLVDEAKAEALQGVRAEIRSEERAARGRPSHAGESDRREGGKLEAPSLVGPRTTAMVRAMSELFAELAHKYPGVGEFRAKALGDRLLTEEEAHNLLASHAARFFTLEQFSDWGIPLVGHVSERVVYDPGLGKDHIEHLATVRVDPPGVTKSLRQ